MAHILIIDDDQPIRQVLGSILKTAGHTVAEAADGAKALSLLQTEMFDVIITDIVMPERDGLEVIMNSQRGTKRTPIIAMTGVPIDSAMYLRTASHLGASRTIQKPFGAEQVLALVNEVLQERERGD
jgi:DNA-binding NtrC family response regulator